MLAAADSGGSEETPPPVPGRVLAGGLAATVAVGAFAIYFALGSPDVPNFPFAERNVGRDMLAERAGLDRGEIAGLAAKLAARLKDNPADTDGWLLLARTYNTIGEFGAAAEAFRRALEVSGGRIDIAGLYGEALVRANDGQVGQEAFTLFGDIVKLEPLNPQARYFVGLALAQRNRVREALQAWVDLRAVSPADAPWLDVVNDQIGRAEAELKLAAGSVKPSADAVALAGQRPPAGAATAPAASQPAGPGGPSAADMEAASRMSAGDRSEMIRGMVERLAARLKDNPDDLEGWRRLARSYRVLGEIDKAKEAEARIEALEKRR
jgi:cytochrome c-type biogenesis protein CcmH